MGAAAADVNEEGEIAEGSASGQAGDSETPTADEGVDTIEHGSGTASRFVVSLQRPAAQAGSAAQWIAAPDPPFSASHQRKAALRVRLQRWRGDLRPCRRSAQRRGRLDRDVAPWWPRQHQRFGDASSKHSRPLHGTEPAAASSRVTEPPSDLEPQSPLALSAPARRMMSRSGPPDDRRGAALGCHTPDPPTHHRPPCRPTWLNQPTPSHT